VTGRKLGPISDAVGDTHRAWLEPLRTRFLASGMTVADLADQSRYSKSKISELLRGEELYPRWEIIHSVLRVLEIPVWPVCRLWAAAALDANKKQEWIHGCISTAVLTITPLRPPLDHRAFVMSNTRAYTSYAEVFLRDRRQVQRAVSATFDILWLRWDEALRSPHVQRFAWRLFRRTVMSRTPHTGGHPELRPAAFETTALDTAGEATQFFQIEESMTMMTAISRLPAQQLDVVVFKHFRRMDDAAIADVLGVPEASVHQAARYARRQLNQTLGLDGETDKGGPFQWN
jgi:DNA-directed RNA polymerase specialized sigma24 family protein